MSSALGCRSLLTLGQDILQLRRVLSSLHIIATLLVLEPPSVVSSESWDFLFARYLILRIDYDSSRKASRVIGFHEPRHLQQTLIPNVWDYWQVCFPKAVCSGCARLPRP